MKSMEFDENGRICRIILKTGTLARMVEVANRKWARECEEELENLADQAQENDLAA